MLVYCLYQLIVDRYLIYLKLHLFWEFTRVKIDVAYIKVTVGCDGRRLILKTLPAALYAFFLEFIKSAYARVKFFRK